MSLRTKEGEKLTAEQAESLERFERDRRAQRTRDMLELLQNPAFLRYLGRWMDDCNVHSAIKGDETNNVMYREGKRSVGEAMRREVCLFNMEKVFEIERTMLRDEKTRRRIINLGEKYDATQPGA